MTEIAEGIRRDIDVLTEAVASRGLFTPAIFFLELYKPLNNILLHIMLVSTPILVPIFGARNIDRVMRILESKELVEDLLVSIENRAINKSGENR